MNAVAVIDEKSYAFMFRTIFAPSIASTLDVLTHPEFAGSPRR